jgi:flagellar biosynthetic protein FlhB
MAEEDDDAQKTEDPSERKLAKAKEKGEVAQSQEVKTWMILMGGGAGLIFMAPNIADGVSRVSFPFIQSPHAIASDFENLRLTMMDVLGDVGMLLAPFLGLLLVLGIASNVFQFGLMFSPEKLKFDLKKISLIKGTKRLVSQRAIVEFIKGILKLVVVGVVSFLLSLPWLGDLSLLSRMDLVQSLDRIYIIAIVLLAGTVAVMTLIAVMDFAFQKHQFTKRMRMSKQEVKDEHKQSEGDPHVKARIRKVRTERAQQRMMANVPDADVIITNPTHYAIALKYKMNDMAAPRLVAKGVDHLAMRIREVGEANDVPVVENPPLARALYAGVDIDEEIPSEHFKAVAEVIGFIMRQRGDLPEASIGANPQVQ